MPVSYTPFSGAAPASTLDDLNDRFQEKEDYFLGLVGGGQNVQQRVSGAAGETLGDRDAAYFNLADNKIYLMDADATGPKAGIIRGFVDGGVIAGADATLVISGLMGGFSGLSGNAAVYVDIVPGSITQTRPVSALDGSQIMIAEMGFSVSASELFVRPRAIQYHRRAAMADNETLTITHHADSASYTRKAMATFMQDITLGSVAASYASSNQDSNEALQGDIYTGGSANSGTQTGTTTNWIGDNANIEKRVGQSFTVSGAGKLSQFTFTLSANNGSPTGDMTWEIRNDSGGSGPGSTVLSTGTISNASVTANAVNTVNVTGGPILQTATTYWLVLIAQAQSTGSRWTWQSATTGTYADGQSAYSTNSGSTWFLEGSDTTFTVTVSAVAPNEKLMQTFNLAGSADIGEVALWLKKVGSPSGTATVRIETVSGGNPTGTLADANATASFAEASLNTSYAAKAIQFPAVFTLSAGDYAIVLSTSRGASETNYIFWGADGSSPGYAGGEMKGYASSAWSSLTKDAVFSVRDESIYNPAWMKVGWWSSTHADLVNRYGDGSWADLSTKTTFKNLRDAGFDDLTVIVEMD